MTFRPFAQVFLREAAKKRYFLSGPATKPLPPPPHLLISVEGPLKNKQVFWRLSEVPIPVPV